MPSAISSSPGTLLNTSNPTDPSTAISNAQQGAGALLNTGSSVTNTALSGFPALLAHFRKLLSSDPSAVNEEVKPQVQSILKQYDTARRTSSEFAPRGGGQTSANITSKAAEASDIAGTKSKAVSDAASSFGQLLAQMLGIGTSATAAGSTDLASLVQSAIAAKGQDQAFWGDLGKGIGIAAAAFLALETGGLSLAAIPAIAGAGGSGSGGAGLGSDGSVGG